MSLSQIIKRAATEAVNASKPVEYTQGAVTSTAPLIILVGQKLPIPEKCLVLTRNVTDYTVSCEINWETELEKGHTHKIGERKSIKVYNSLNIGDKVIMLRVQGGQRYVVLDKVGE